MSRVSRYTRSIRGRFDWGELRRKARAAGKATLGSVSDLAPHGRLPFAWAANARREHDEDGAPMGEGDGTRCCRCSGSGRRSDYDAKTQREIARVNDECAVLSVRLCELTFESGIETRRELGIKRKLLAKLQEPKVCPACDGVGIVEWARAEGWFDALERVALANDLEVVFDGSEIGVQPIDPVVYKLAAK